MIIFDLWHLSETSPGSMPTFGHMPNIEKMLCGWSVLPQVLFHTWMAVCDQHISVEFITIQSSHASNEALLLHGVGAAHLIALKQRPKLMIYHVYKSIHLLYHKNSNIQWSLWDEYAPWPHCYKYRCFTCIEIPLWRQEDYMTVLSLQ